MSPHINVIWCPAALTIIDVLWDETWTSGGCFSCEHSSVSLPTCQLLGLSCHTPGRVCWVSAVIWHKVGAAFCFVCGDHRILALRGHAAVGCLMLMLVPTTSSAPDMLCMLRPPPSENKDSSRRYWWPKFSELKRHLDLLYVNVEDWILHSKCRHVKC